jgi:hypothetical protein
MQCLHCSSNIDRKGKVSDSLNQYETNGKLTLRNCGGPKCGLVREYGHKVIYNGKTGMRSGCAFGICQDSKTTWER